MYTINTSPKHIEIKTVTTKPNYTVPFEKTVVVDIPEGYTHIEGEFKIKFFNNNFIAFVTCTNDKTLVPIIYILTKSCKKFKFVEFLEIKNYKKGRYKLRKRLAHQSIDNISMHKIGDKTVCILWSYETAPDESTFTIKQTYFEKTEDSKWFLNERRVVSFDLLSDYMKGKVIISDTVNNKIKTKKVEEVMKREFNYSGEINLIY